MGTVEHTQVRPEATCHPAKTSIELGVPSQDFAQMLGCRPSRSDNYGCPDLTTLQEGHSLPFFALEGNRVSGQEISIILEVPVWVFR